MSDRTSTAREDLAALPAMHREDNRVLVIVAELLVEQNTMLRELLEQQQQRASSPAGDNVAPAGTSAGAGRPAITGPTPVGGGKETAVRLTEPEVPPADDDQGDDTGGRPVPARKKTAPAKKPGAADRPRARGQGGR